MIKRFLTYMVALFAFAACSDDFSAPMGGGIDEDGNLHLAFNLTPMQTVSTRAGETAIDGMTSVWMYVYDGTGGLLDSKEITVTNTSGSLYTGSVPLDKKITSKKSSARFVFVANLPEYSETGQTLETHQKETTGSLYDTSTKCLALSSKDLGWTDVTGDNVKIDLYHNAAKVSVNHGVLDASGNLVKDTDGYYKLDDTNKYSFNTLGTAPESAVLAGGMDKTENPSDISFRNFSHDNKEKFVHPTTNTGSYANRSYVIVRAEYGGNNYFYRLDFQKKVKSNDNQTEEEALASGNLTTSPLDIKPNHWYQFIIKSVKGPGYLTVDEAAKNPTPMIDYQIHDHAPVIYDMISDGSRELGVSKEVVNMNGNPTDVDPTSTAILNIKLFSLVEGEDGDLALTSEEFANGDWKKYISFEDDWVTVQSIKELSGADNVGNNHPDTNNTGRVYAVTLAFKKTNNPGVLKTNLAVTWHGLSRVVPVEWRRTFDTDALLKSVAFKAFNSASTNWNTGAQFSSDKYFGDFLKNKVVGANREANNDIERADGFHFPVRYGDGTHWTYMYKVTVNPDLMAAGQGWKISVTDNRLSDDVTDPNHRSDIYFSMNGSSDWKNSAITGDKNNTTFYIRCSDTDYNYYTAYFNLSITDAAGKTLIIYDNIKVHHTGFFHKDGKNPTNVSTTSFIKDGESNSDGFGDIYTYYEVVKVGGDYWLDRNIGAKSANVYIKNGYGDSKATGYYIVAADYLKHNDPKIYEGMTPPGYDVPSVEQWDNLRKSSNFKIQLFQSYYNPTCVSDDGKTTMYFPKAQYYEGTTLQGENRAGYYWTKTAATGTEKDEIGNWLKCMTMAGTATSYINGRVRGKDTPYYMSLRAVSKSEGSKMQRLSFWVEGATHVFLYTKDGNERNAVTTWPGQSIGNWQTMTEGQEFNFSYQYSSNQAQEFYVIFNYVNDKGQIYTMSNNNFTGNLTHTNIRPEDAEGWKVIGTSSTAFTSTSGVEITGILDSNKSTDGTTWKCHPVYAEIPEPDYKTYRAYWPKSSNQTGLHIYTNSEAFTTWNDGGGNNKTDDRYPDYWYVEFIPDNQSNSDTVVFMYMWANNSNKYIPNKTLDEIFTHKIDDKYCVFLTSNTTVPTGYLSVAPSQYVDPRNMDGVPSGMRRIFWDNNEKNWGKVKIHYWGGSSATEWPGIDMVKLDNRYWYCNIPEDSKQVIFNNGSGSQTGDIDLGSGSSVEDNTYSK